MSDTKTPAKRGRPKREPEVDEVEESKDDIIAEMLKEEEELEAKQKEEIERLAKESDPAWIIENRAQYIDAGDPASIIDAAENPMNGMICVHMQSGVAWVTSTGVRFSKEEPFHVLPSSDAEVLLRNSRFKVANREEVVSFYEQKKW